MNTDVDNKNVLILKTPLWVKLFANLAVIAFILFRKNNFLILVDHIWITVLFLPMFCIINTYLHEKCHALSYQLLTGQPATIKFNLLSGQCKPHSECSVAVFKFVALAPIAIIAFWGTVIAICLWLSFAQVVILLLISGLAFYIAGMAGDFYWYWLVRNIPLNYIIKDYGAYAEVNEPDN